MSNKKSRKLINIMLSAMMLLGIGSTQTYAADVAQYGKNGVSYVLLSTEFSYPGVYRYNDYKGDVTNPWKIYITSTLTGKVSGLAANQNNEVFLLSAIEGDKFNDAPVGWLPTGIKFEEDSKIYLAVAGPSDGGAKDYKRDGYPSWHSWPTDGDSSSGQYWKRDQTFDGKHYEYAVKFGGPKGVKYLNGESGTTGTPIWDGTYKPESTSNAAAIKHPTDPRKVILPSHVGALSYYLYGTSNDTTIEGRPMDGSSTTQEEYVFTKANGAGVFSGDDKHAAGTMFGCIVKRFYQKRENSLNLYSAIDKTSISNQKPTNQSMTQTQANVLKTIDVKVREAYGKLCGDNCIEGGEIGGAEVETALSTVTVVTSTTGNRYGFNPLGVFKGSSSTDASLRVVKTNGTTKTIDIATDDAGQNFSSNITNKEYLKNAGIAPSSIKTIGVSSNFNKDLDYIYGSGADYFVVQDSWWGKGGIAYEYYKGTDENPGKVVKIDYVNNDNQIASETLGDLTGNVDGIAIDGDGYLYALKTEESPSDPEMEGAFVNPNPANTSLKIGNTDYPITYSGWRRDIQTSTDDETLNDGYIDIPEGQQQAGDYKLATVKQNIYKAVKRYPQATGKLGKEEERGSMFAGYDTWVNKLKMTNRAYSWDYPQWKQEEGTKTSSLRAELAVVNVADSPKPFDGTTKLQTIVACDSNFNQQISEDESLTFKVEGYRPYIDGTERELIDIGDVKIAGKEHHIYLNTIPNSDGEYKHDENNDNLFSGFPSYMFETTSMKTTVTWNIEYVENLSVADYISNPKIIKHVETGINSTDAKKQKLNYKFKDPGRYIVKANVTYNIFTNFGSAKTPNDLLMGTRTVTAEPTMICVAAKSLNLNNSPSYITNIKLDLSPENNLKIGLNEDSSSLQSESSFDCVEGSGDQTSGNERKFGKVVISFDAQFVREADSEDEKVGLQTYDGIGVWDYKTYADMYRKLSGFNVQVPDTSNYDNVYNHIGFDDQDLTKCYNPNILNSGKAKVSDPNGIKANSGTRIDKEPTDKDFEFIQWALYLRKFSSPDEKITDVKTDIPRGIFIKSGKCANNQDSNIVVKKENNGNRNYTVTVEVNNIDSLIDTPRDPNGYVFDLEIIYPRVAWLNNSLGGSANDPNKYFSSIVPYNPNNNMSPVHILTFLEANSAPIFVNKSDNAKFNVDNGLCTIPSQGKLFNDEPASFTLCVRDKDKPVFQDNTADLPYYETTGDPTIAGKFEYVVSDNNPFFSVEKFSSNTYNSKASILTNEDALSATKLVMQTLKTPKFDNSEENKIYEVRSDTTPKVTLSRTSDNDPEFVRNDSWKIIASYSVTTKSLSADVFLPKGNSGEVPETMISATDNLDMENWVGTLNYAVLGKFYDGLGPDGNYTAHYLYDPTVYSAGIDGYPTSISDKELEQTIDIIDTEGNHVVNKTSNPYLERMDNDPASIEVELVSQSDNRRWVIQLIEGVNDNVSFAKTVDELAPSNLVIQSYKLIQNEANEQKPLVYKVPGTTNYYNNKKQNNPPNGCVATAIVTDFANTIPSFKRAGRLLINVNIFDNCGYLPLEDAKIKVENIVANNSTVLIDKDIKTDASHTIEGSMKDEFKNKPRGTYAVDLPMLVDATQPQIRVTVSTKDNAGNERNLVIPITLLESSFETRVLETKEERK